MNRYNEELATNGPRGIHYLTLKLTSDAMLLCPDVINDVVGFCIATCTSLLGYFGNSNQMSSVNASMERVNIESDWIVSETSLNQDQSRLILQLPEHIVDDVMDLMLFVSRTEPNLLNRAQCSMSPLLNFIIFFLRRPWSVTSPHLRAKFGLVLASVFLPAGEARGGLHNYTNTPFVNGPQSYMLESNLEAQYALAPALLLLYGDVERTGFYEKLEHRQNIMLLLKHLWSLPSHRGAFRGIANCAPENNSNIAAPQEQYFIRFANGLMNETNSLVASTLELLASIKNAQVKMANYAEMNAMNEETKKEFMELYEQNERDCRHKAVLCAQTLNMLTYLTSDEVIKKPFLQQEILPRFVSMLLNILNRLVGTKSLELKVENMEKYLFHPKDLLRDVCESLIHFSDDAILHEVVAKDGFYEDGAPLRKAIATVSKASILSLENIEKLKELEKNISNMKGQVQNLDALTEEAPFEFLDPLLMSIMIDPVILPSSKTIVDRTTIAQHLLNEETGSVIC